MPMARYAMTAVFAVLLGTVTVSAKEIRGIITSVDVDKSTLTITVKDGDMWKEITFAVAKDATVTEKTKNRDNELVDTDVEDGLRNQRFKSGKTGAIITTDNDDDTKAKVTKVSILRSYKDPAPDKGKKCKEM